MRSDGTTGALTDLEGPDVGGLHTELLDTGKVLRQEGIEQSAFNGSEQPRLWSDRIWIQDALASDP